MDKLQPTEQPNIEHTSITALRPVPAITTEYVEKWRREMQRAGRNIALEMIERDLQRLLEDTRSKAYVKGFRSGQQTLLAGGTNGHNPERPK